MEKNTSLNDLMRSTLDRVREMADTNTIIGKPITTPDGVTLIPVSRLSFGFGSGGGSYGKAADGFAGGGGAGVKIDPVAFLTIRDGVTRVLPVAMPAMNTVDRIIDTVPDVVTKVENFFESRREQKAAESETDAD